MFMKMLYMYFFLIYVYIFLFYLYCVKCLNGTSRDAWLKLFCCCSCIRDLRINGALCFLFSFHCMETRIFIFLVISWYLYFVRQAGYVFKGMELQDTELQVSVCNTDSEVSAYGISCSCMFELRISSCWHRFYILDFEMYGGIVS